MYAKPLIVGLTRANAFLILSLFMSLKDVFLFCLFTCDAVSLSLVSCRKISRVFQQ
ncbi:hypothetical protein SBDP2_840010 [Syntrophobacter sp. SbD2]|nr:hypothetical protein SBDP2_840010 [Syntrophobacter sp. SbD2]